MKQSGQTMTPEQSSVIRTLFDREGVRELLRSDGGETESPFLLLRGDIPETLARGNISEALAWAKEAYSSYETSSDEKKTASILHTLGSLYATAEDWEQARISFSLARKIAERNHDASMLAHIFSSLASVYLSVGNFLYAGHHYRQALSIWENLGDEEQIATLRQRLAYIDERSPECVIPLTECDDSSLRSKIGNLFEKGMTSDRSDSDKPSDGGKD